MYSEIVAKIAHRSIYADIMKDWEWGEGVSLAGVSRAYEQLGDQTLKLAEPWVNYQLKHFYPEWNVNKSALSQSLISLYKMTGDNIYLKAAEDNIEYLLNKTPRVYEGAIEHTVTCNNWSEQCWADTLFMAGIFLGRFGKEFDRQDCMDECIKQFLLHHKYLSDGNGLYYHGYNHKTKDNMSAVRWARANGWIILTTVELITEIIDESCPEYSFFKEKYQAHVERLVQLQDAESGYWHTVLDMPESYTESSASCAIAYGILRGIKAGLIDKKYLANVRRVIDRLIENDVDDIGGIHNVSAGTDIYKTKEDYNKVPLHLIHGWGQGLAVYLLSEWEHGVRNSVIE